MFKILHDLALEFCRKQNKHISISTEIHVNHDQIHHIGNNWLGPIFSSPGDSYTKGLLVMIHSSLESVTEIDTDPKKEGLYPLRLLPLMTEFSVFIPLQGTAG